MKRLILSLLTLLIFNGLYAKKNILIIYDGKENVSNGYISLCYMKDMLGHFDIQTMDSVNAVNYKRGILKKKDFVFVLMDEAAPTFNNMMIKDLLHFKGGIIWTNRHLQKFLDASHNKYGFSVGEVEKRNDWQVYYKNESLPKEDPALNLVTVEKKNSDEVSVLSWVKDKTGRQFPYFIQSGNLWYIADSPFSFADEGGRFLVLADVLHVIFNEKHPVSRQAMIRIEDINALSNPENIRTVVNYLYDEGIPFQISLVPIYKDPNTQTEIYLSEKPEMVKVIKEAVSRGGTVVMHGVTHQYRGITGDDYEFWDDIGGKSIPFESTEWIAQRIRTGISELFRCGIYPLAWETPHYSASQETYRVVSRYFDTSYDRVMALEMTDTQLPLPYPAKIKELGISVIPENMGYIDIGKPDPTRILENAKNVSVVRDGIASFFFHPFVDIKYLKEIIHTLKDRGYTFISLKNFKCNLRTDYQWITSAGGRGKITLANQYFHEILFDQEGTIKKEYYSKERQSGVITKDIEVTPGYMYVMDAVDLLPPKPVDTGLLTTAKNWIKDLFSRKKEQTALSVFKSLVISSKNASPEENFDQKSFESVLKIFGFNPEIKELGSKKKFSLSGYGLLVVPYASAKRLMDVEINSILDFVEKGGVLITDGKTRLSSKLGMRFADRTVKIKDVKDVTVASKKIQWAQPLLYNPFFCDKFTLLARDNWNGEPLAVITEFGKGRVLFFGPLFDPYTPYGISRFPYLPHYLKNSLGLSFNVRRNNLEFYFDPGLIERQGVSKEKLVKRWRSSGVKIIYLAAWHFYKKYTFDYKYFIELCHNHGIAVYAWFELPYVTQDFWNEHPEWHEITAALSDAPPSWRYLINLQDPEAREAVNQYFHKILNTYDWDGVNLAELNYDTDRGLKNPVKFVPMNQIVRQEFKKAAKFDPLDLFNPKSAYYWEKNSKALQKFIDYRKAIVTEWHTYFLNELEQIKKDKKKDMEIIVTMMDSVFHPEIVEECGVDTLDIIRLMDRYPFTLQVEDPSRSWVNSPNRYALYFDEYKKHVKNLSRLMFDINVVNRQLDPALPLPSRYAIGTELASTLYYAANGSGRAGIYAESTVDPVDMDILPFVLGSDVDIKENKEGNYAIDSKRPFTLAISNPNYIVYLNGETWPFFGPRGISIPSGKQQLILKKIHTMDLHNLNASITFEGDMYDLNLMGDIYSLRYDSPTPVALSFNRPLERIMVDSRRVDVSVEKNSMILPKGEHTLEIFVESRPSRAINVIGYFSSTVFYTLGLLSVVLLLVIYFYSRIKR
ncbi:MAG: DUF2334 domain-containing protein [Candidatus Omnitrophota bacterium]